MKNRIGFAILLTVAVCLSGCAGVAEWWGSAPEETNPDGTVTPAPAGSPTHGETVTQWVTRVLPPPWGYLATLAVPAIIAEVQRRKKNTARQEAEISARDAATLAVRLDQANTNRGG